MHIYPHDTSNSGDRSYKQRGKHSNKGKAFTLLSLYDLDSIVPFALHSSKKHFISCTFDIFGMVLPYLAVIMLDVYFFCF